MVRELYDEGVLPFRYIVADCLYGNSPEFWAAGEACVGTVAFVAIPEDTRVWLAPVATPEPHLPLPGGGANEARSPHARNAGGSVANLHRSGGGAWYRRTVSEGTKGPITYEFARRRVTLCKEGSCPDRLAAHQADVGAEPTYSYYISNAPSAPHCTFVWFSGLRWAIEQCFEEGKTELGMDHYEVRKYPAGITICC